MPVAEKTPSLVSFGIGSALFGNAVVACVLASIGCSLSEEMPPWMQKMYGRNCSSEIVHAILGLLGFGLAVVAGWMSWSTSSPGLGIAGGFAGLAVHALQISLSTWCAIGTTPAGGVDTGTEATEAFEGMFWMAIAGLMAWAAFVARGNNETVIRKEPWALVGALGLYHLGQATGAWHQAALIQDNGGYWFGYVLGGFGLFLGFALLGFAAAVSLSTRVEERAAPLMA